MPYIGSKCWTYLDTREAIIIKFIVMLLFCLEARLCLLIIKKIIDEFANFFYYNAQILKGCGALTTFDAKFALKYALKPIPS